MYQKQLTETDRAKREGMLREIQELLYARTRSAPLYDYFWPSGVGPRVEEASLMKIDPFPWAAPLEDVRLRGSKAAPNYPGSCQIHMLRKTVCRPRHTVALALGPVAGVWAKPTWREAELSPRHS